MKEEWYNVEGVGEYSERGVHLMSVELLVKATSVEDACVKAREFIKPIAELIPLKCEWSDKCDH